MQKAIPLLAPGQREMLTDLIGPAAIAGFVGHAGTGKSTKLATANEAVRL